MQDGGPRFSELIRPVKRILPVVVFVLGLLALAPLSILMVTARTGPGRLAGWAALTALLAFTMTAIAVRTETLDARHVVAIVVPTIACAAVFAVLLLRPPPDGSTQATGLLSVFVEPFRFQRHSIWNAIPEIDAVTLAAALLTRLDPWMSSEHARRTRYILNELYDEIEFLDPIARHGRRSGHRRASRRLIPDKHPLLRLHSRTPAWRIARHADLPPR
jgi:hypothetical protein